ncbi:MAG: Asp23/Gls24 family envelope stress response protein [Burkholderiaceae bacterium]|nr:Asp23/Gls24 family envelope stress response protein [Microbacteriaceae bacterium]
MTELDETGLDGHTLDELSDYLDRGRVPADPAIEASPGCQIALRALERVRTVSASLLAGEARDTADDGWVATIIGSISLDARAGRDIPVTHSDPSARLSLTEGAVRGLIRAAGDSVGGVLIGRCRLDGDVTIPGEPITVHVDASVFYGERIPDAAQRVRQAIYRDLGRHTELVVEAVDVTVHDVQAPGTPGRTPR